MTTQLKGMREEKKKSSRKYSGENKSWLNQNPMKKQVGPDMGMGKLGGWTEMGPENGNLY